MAKKAKPNVYAFIDSQNLNLGSQRMGWKVDWRRFRQFLYDKYNVTQAYMFIGYMSENESLYEYMHELGYLVVLKPTIDVSSPDNSKEDSNGNRIHEEREKPTVKGNVDAELVLYAMKEQPNYDKAIIVSGDGDFFSLVEYLDEVGKLDCVMAPNWQYSSLLKPYEDRIVRLDKLRRRLAYHDKKKIVKKEGSRENN
jgi:uncharacterized LabA/DUF88 family protein